MKKNLLATFGAAGALAGGIFFLQFSVAAADTTAVLLPSSEGNYSQWTPKSGSTHYTMVDETSCNGNTDFVSTTTVGGRDSYRVSLSSVPTDAVITKLEIKPCASRKNTGQGSSALDVFYRFNGSDSADAGAYSLTGTSPSELATTTFSSLSLTNSASSTLEIGAVFTSGNKGAKLSRIAVVMTYSTLPGAPSNLTASALSSSTTNFTLLQWTDNSNNESGFKLESSTDNVIFTEIQTPGSNSTIAVDGPLTSGLTYYYRIRAYNLAGNSGYSNTASYTVP